MESVVVVMSYAQSGADALEYNTWRHGASRLVFRGPRMRFDGAFNLALGDAATFGRFIERPWPGQVDAATGVPMANLGAVHAGVEALTLDPEIAGLMGRAQAVVIQITGAHLVSNAYYRVHPRRNDRFIAATPKLVELFPEVDFHRFQLYPAPAGNAARDRCRALCPHGDRVARLLGGPDAGADRTMPLAPVWRCGWPRRRRRRPARHRRTGAAIRCS
jgi:hypothetical protein